MVMMNNSHKKNRREPEKQKQENKETETKQNKLNITRKRLIVIKLRTEMYAPHYHVGL